MRDERQMARTVEPYPFGFAAEQHRSARARHDFGELHRQDARAALDEPPARLEVAALRQGEERPGQPPRIVSVVTEIGADRIFGRFVRAEMALEDLRRRGAPVGDKAARLEEAVDQLAERMLFPRLRQFRTGVDDMLHRAEQFREAPGVPGKPLAQSLARRVKTGRKIEGLSDRAAPDRIERRNGDPFDLVEETERLEDPVLGIARVMRIGGLVQRRLDRQRPLPEGGRRSADAVVALDHADLAPRLGEQGRSRQPAQTRADDDRLKRILAHPPPLSGAPY